MTNKLNLLLTFEKIILSLPPPGYLRKTEKKINSDKLSRSKTQVQKSRGGRTMSRADYFQNKNFQVELLIDRVNC